MPLYPSPAVANGRRSATLFLAFLLASWGAARAELTAGLTVPGSTNYPNAGLRTVGELTAEDEISEDSLACAVIDSDRGYVYFGTNTNPGIVVKLRVGEGNAPPRRVGAVVLNEGESRLITAAIDPDAGYAYFGSDRNRVIKIALGAGDEPPRRVGALSLEMEQDLKCMAIDSARGYGYLGLNGFPGRVLKIALGQGEILPSVVSSMTLADAEYGPEALALDATAGYGYIAAANDDYHGRGIKFALGEGADPPVRIGHVDGGQFEDHYISALVDPIRGYVYFGSESGVVVKVAPGAGSTPPVRIGSAATANFRSGAFIDVTNGYAYFAGDQYGIYKFRLGNGDAPPELVGDPLGNFFLYSGPTAAVIDSGAGFAFIADPSDYPGIVYKVDLGEGDLGPRIAAAEYLNTEESYSTIMTDPIHEHIYLGTAGPGEIVKLAMGVGPEPPRRIGYLTLGDGENYVQAGIINPEAGFAYFIVYELAPWNHNIMSLPVRIVKVALGDGDELPTRVGAISLKEDESLINCGVIDPAAGFGYFGAAGYAYFDGLGTAYTTGRIVKVALGEGTAPPSRVSAVDLLEENYVLTSGAIDKERGHAYFAGRGGLLKIGLSADSSPPSIIGGTNYDYSFFYGEVELDLSRNLAFCRNSEGDRLVKFALGEGDAAPFELASIAIANPTDVQFDPDTNIIYATSDGGSIHKIRPESGSTPPFLLGSGSGGLNFGAIDDDNGYLYYTGGPYTFYLGGNKIKKIAYTQKDQLKLTKITLSGRGQINSFSFYSHAAEGNLRLAIYGDAAPRSLLWESAEIPNTAANGWLSVSIPSGQPQSLILDPGTYWLGWQVEIKADVPSFTAGLAGTGLIVPHAFGPAPEKLESSSPVSSNEKWSVHLTYEALTPTPSPVPTPPPARILDALLGRVSPDTSFDVNGDGSVDIADLLAAE